MKLLFFIVALAFLVSCSIANNSEPRFPFQTGEADSIPHYNLIVMGDNKPKMSILEIFFSLSNKAKPDHLVHLGDFIPFSSPLGFHAALEALELLSSSIQTHFVIGNHDVADSTGSISNTGINLYNDLMNVNNNNGYYTIEEDNYVLIILNTTFPLYNSINTEQYNWLETELQNAQGKTILVFTHHPIYPAGHHSAIETADQFHTLMQSYQVKAVFSGHEHLYYKTEQDNITYVVSGGAGSNLHNSENGTAIYHMLGITIDPFTIDVLDIGGNIIEF